VGRNARTTKKRSSLREGGTPPGVLRVGMRDEERGRKTTSKLRKVKAIEVGSQGEVSLQKNQKKLDRKQRRGGLLVADQHRKPSGS